MRSTIAVTAFAIGALAVPYNKPRDVVTDIDIVYATEYVTVYAGEEPTSTPAPAPTTTPVTNGNHFPHGHHSHQNGGWTSAWTSAWTSTWTSEAAPPAYSAPPPAYSAPPAPSAEESSTYVAPAPSSTYVAPTTSSTPPAYTPPAPSSVAPAPPSYSAPAPSSSVDSGAKPTDYAGIAVYHHNLHRANHSSPDISWSDALAATAGKTAATCNYAHDVETDKGNYENGYGQNIAAGVEAKNISAIITNLFYNGEVNYFAGLYNETNPDMTNFEEWGHFSQIVWQSTTEVGCATQNCTKHPGGLANVGDNVAQFFTVCNYHTAGNYGGEYADNIKAPSGHPSCNWNTGL